MGFFLLFIFFIAPFLIEGLGIGAGHKLVFYWYLIVPSFLAAYSILAKKSITFPKRATIFFLSFLLFSLISSLFFSVDKQVSFELTLFYISSFFIFIFFYNHKKEGNKTVFFTLLFGGAIFILISFLLLAAKPFSVPFLFPTSEYQFVYSYFRSHNHLGDFLGLVLIGTTYLLIRKKYKLLLPVLILCFVIFLFSLSRSAYAALFITILVVILPGGAKDDKKTILRIGLLSATVVIASFFVLTLFATQEAQTKFRDDSFFLSIYRRLPKDFLYKSQQVLSARNEYFSQALQSINKNPLFGIGPGNFGYASSSFMAKAGFWTDTTHNIFVEIAATNGVLALIGFLIFFVLVFISAIRKKSFTGLLLLYILINFQADYTYKIYSFFILFIILAALVYEEQTDWKGTTAYVTLSFTLWIIFLSILTSNNFIKINKTRLANFFYPLNKQTYETLIKEEQKRGNYSTVIQLSKRYEWISYYNLTTVKALGEIYENYQEKNKALLVYENAYKRNPYMAFPLIKKTYELKKEVKSKKDASQFLQKVVKSYLFLPYQSPAFIKTVVEFCNVTKEKACQEAGWK